MRDFSNHSWSLFLHSTFHSDFFAWISWKRALVLQSPEPSPVLWMAAMLGDFLFFFLIKVVQCLQYFMLRIEKMAVCSQQASEYLIPRAKRCSVYICIYFSSGFNVFGSFYKTGMLSLFSFFLYDDESTDKTIITSVFISYSSACPDIFWWIPPRISAAATAKKYWLHLRFISRLRGKKKEYSKSILTVAEFVSASKWLI